MRLQVSISDTSTKTLFICEYISKIKNSDFLSFLFLIKIYIPIDICHSVRLSV